MVEAILYISICILTGLCGKNTRIGFLGTFLIAVVVSPLLLLPAIMLLDLWRRGDRTPHRVWRG